MSYATFVMGKDAVFYSPEALAALSAGMMFHKPYYSTWRVLHVDGFEDHIFLPVCIGKQIHFSFNQKAGQTTFDGRHTWTNVGKIMGGEGQS
jgi:hypothetical protein